MTATEKLQRLHRGPTRYELIAERGDTRVLIAYSMRTGRHALLTACQKHGPKLIEFMNVDHDSLLMFLKPASLGAEIGPADNPWKIRFSGRTQREAVSSELPFIGDLASEPAA